MASMEVFDSSHPAQHRNSFQLEPFKFGSALSGVLAFDVSGKSYEGVNNLCKTLLHSAEP